MNFSNLILVLTFILSCVQSACSDTEVEIRMECTTDYFKNKDICITQNTHFKCADNTFGWDPTLDSDCPKSCHIGSLYLGPEGREYFAGPVCSNRTVNPDPKQHYPCSEHTCYAQISPDGTQLTTCGPDCPDYLLTQTTASTGRCVMKTCSLRKPNTAVSPICGAGICFQQINPGTADLKDACGESCPEQNLTTTNTTTNKCQMRTCSDRIPSTSVTKHCGNACYQKISSISGAAEDDCVNSCPDPNLIHANNTNGMCELKICGSRVPTNNTLSCGPNCFKQIDSATGGTEETCMSLCPDQRLTQQNTALGKCELKPCASRTPNPGVTPQCGPQCVLQEDNTCLPPIEVDEEDDVGGEGGEGDEGDVGGGTKAQAGDDGSSLSNVYLALAVMLPVIGVIFLISGISCIVMIVMQAKTESKAKRIDVADEEKNVVDQVVEYIEAAAGDAALDPALSRPAPLPRKSMRKSVRGSKRVSTKLQDEEK